MRDIVILAIVLGGVPVAILRPQIGVLLWVWFTYMNPHRFTWGAAYDFPVQMTIGGATLVGVGLAFFKGECNRFPLERETVLLIGLWGFFTLSTIFALDSETAWIYWVRTSKILILAVCILLLVSGRKQFEYLLYTIVFSIGFFGFKGGLFSLATGFQNRVWGPDGSFLADANDIAMCLNIILPSLFFLSKHSINPKIRYALLGTFGLSILAIIGTYSRGGFVTLMITLLYLVSKSNKKLILFTGVLVASLVVVPLLPDKYFKRVESIETASQEDDSVLQRFNAWWFNWNLAVDRPIVGGGFEPIRQDIWIRYAPEFHNIPNSAHSIYFQVLGDHGFIAFGMFLGILGGAFFSCGKIQKQAKRLQEYSWLADYAIMLRLGIVAFMVAGLFYNRAYVDIFYHLICLVVLLKVLAREEFAKLNTSVRVI